MNKAIMEIQCNDDNTTTIYLTNPELDTEFNIDKQIKTNKAILLGEIMIKRCKDLMNLSLKELEDEYIDQLKLRNSGNRNGEQN